MEKMRYSNLHTHTTFSDGVGSVKQNVESAISKNMLSLGFSDHSFTACDPSYCMHTDRYKAYIDEVNAAKKEYEGTLPIFLGLEKDYYSDIDTTGFDYVIGSVHYVKKDEKYLDVDMSEEDFCNSVSQVYGGDFYAFCKDYYKNIADVYNKTKCDIIGHFDLVTKFNEGNKLFDETDKRYATLAINAVDELLKNNVIFEINTGAISRGYKTAPYPARFILERIFEKGGSIILSGDTHSADTLCYAFDTATEYIKSVGFSSVKTLTQNGFQDYKI